MSTRGASARDRVLEQRAAALKRRRMRREGRLKDEDDAPRSRLRPGAAAANVGREYHGLTDGGTTDRGVVIAFSVVGIAVVLLYWRTFYALQQIWEQDPNYSHGYLVPLVSGFFAWRLWNRHGLPSRDTVNRLDVVIGSIEVAAAMSLHFLAWFMNAPMLDVVALVGILHGTLVVMGGTEGAKVYACPVLYLLFMAPIPVQFYQPVAIFMQQFVSRLSVATLQVMGISAFREGYIVHVPNYTMEVGEACSGLRQLTAFLALSVAAAHLSDRRAWYKWALVLLSIPTAAAANCVRVTLTGIIMMLFGEKYAKDAWHTLEGLAVFIVGIGLFLVFSWLLMKFDDFLLAKNADEPSANADGASVDEDAPERRNGHSVSDPAPADAASPA